MKNWAYRDIATLLDTCDELAMSYYDAPGSELKADRSVVTLADKAIETFLAKEFDRPDEGVYLIGEETAPKRPETYFQAAAETAWIVDPIDGTAPYSCHVPTWGVSIAFMKAGKIEEGAILLPVTGELFLTDGDRVLSAVRTDRAKPWRDADFRPFPVKRCPLDDRGVIAISQTIAKRGKIDVVNPVQALCCAVMPLPYLCLGRYLGYIGSLYLWDYAGGYAIIEKLGFTSRFLSGGKMTGRPEEDCLFDQPGVRRWKARDEIVFAADDRAADFIVARSANVHGEG